MPPNLLQIFLQHPWTPGVSVQVQAMRIAVLGSLTFTVMAFAYAIASAPTRVASRLGLRGLKRQRVLAQNELWAGIEPLVRWLGVRVSGILSDEQRSEIDRQIGLAGDYLGITADEYLALSLLSAVAGGVAGGFAGYLLEFGGITIVVGVMLGAAMPYMHVSGIAQDRLKNIGRGLPYIIDLMALSMGAGLDFPGAVRQVVDKTSNPDDPLVEEFTLILQTMNLGRTRREALLEFARRAPVETVTEFVNSLVQAEERGNPVAEVLLIQATVSRTRRSIRAEEMAAKAGVQMVGPLMLVFFCIMGLLMGPALMNIMEDSDSPMRVLRFQTRLPTGQVEQLTMESERVLIGSGAHCEIRLPLAEARVEHVLIELGPAGVFARALSFEPPPTINNVPFTQAPLPMGAVLGVTGSQIFVEIVETSGAAAGLRKEKKSSPITLLALLIILPAGGYLLLGSDEGVGGGEETRPAPPELWGPPVTQCPHLDRGQALGYARERMAVADAKRERRPFHVQDGVSAVPTYETAAACFRQGGDPASGNLADESGKYLRREMTDDFRMRRVRLDHALTTEDYVSAQKEVRVLLQFVEGKSGEYVTWLSNLDRKLKLKIGALAEGK